MNLFLIGCGLGALVVVCVGVPFLAPWSIRVRYLVNAQVADPVFGLAPLPRLVLREVKISAVRPVLGHVELEVEERGTRWGRHTLLTRDACGPGLVARLDGWSTLHTPLLLIVDEDGQTHLYGPDGSVTNLAPEGEKIR